MPAETHQRGRHACAQSVLELLVTLLEDSFEVRADSTLPSLGVDNECLLALWDAVCEEFAERALGPEIEPDAIEASMTLETAARIMARLLEEGRHAD